MGNVNFFIGKSFTFPMEISHAKNYVRDRSKLRAGEAASTASSNIYFENLSSVLEVTYYSTSRVTDYSGKLNYELNQLVR